jgi:sugar phosphate permease
MRSIGGRVWGYRYVILVVVWLLYVINYFDRIAVLTFLPYIQQDLALTPVQVGQLASVFFFAYALAQISAGYLADRIGPKKVMGLAIVVFTAVTALTGLVRTFWQFILLRIGLGLGEGHHFAPAVKTINQWFPANEKGRATSFFATAWAVAPAIVPVILTTIAATFFNGAWRPVFFLLAIPGLFGIFILWRFVSDWPKEMLDKGRVSEAEYRTITGNAAPAGPRSGQEDVVAQERRDGTPDGTDEEERKNKGVFLRDPFFYLYTVALFCQLMVYWGTTTWLTTFLVSQHGMDLKTMGVFASAPYVVAFFAMLLGGFLMDKVFGRMKPIALIAYVGCIPVLYALGQVATGNTGLLLGLLLLSGFFINLNFGSIYAYVQKRYPKQVVGSAAGVSNGIGQLGSFVAPLGAGYLVVVTADGSQNFAGVFVFFAAAAGVAALCSLFLSEKRLDTPALPSPGRAEAAAPRRDAGA